MSISEPGSGKKYFAAATKGERTGAFAVPGEGDTLKPSELPNAAGVGRTKTGDK